MPKTASKKNSKKTSKEPKKYKLYCGIDEPIPDGYRLGSMEECLNAGKVNYYGIKKVDSRLLAVRRNEVKVGELNKQLDKFRAEAIGFSGKTTKYNKMIASAKTDKEKKALQKKIDEITKKKAEITKQMNKIKEQINKLK
jgi:hypothetical protein